MSVKTLDMRHYYACNKCWLESNSIYELIGIKLRLTLHRIEKPGMQLCWLCFTKGKTTKAIGYLQVKT